MMPISGPAATPTEPGLRARGGSGFEAIWCDASVMPYASITGAWNVSSSSAITCGGSDADDERTKRSGFRAMLSWLRLARARIAWCIVGTAVYQVGWAASSQAKKRKALKPGVQNTDAPAASDESVAAISPWMWNSGMMFMQRSAGVSASVWLMWRAEAVRLLWLSGTCFGREVVPEVWSTSAISSGWAR